MWSPPPQKTQGLEGGKPRWVDSFLISEVCPILSETNLGACWKLLLLNFDGSLPEVNDWQGHLSSLSHTCIQMLQVYFIGTPPVSTADLCRPYKGVKEVRALDNGEAICWESESPKSSLNGTCLAGKKKNQESLGLWESGFLLVFEHFVGVCCCHHDLFGFFVSPPMKNVTRLRNLAILMWRLQTNGQPTSGESINQLAGSRG